MNILNSIEEAIILYAPVVLVYITQIVDWAVTVKKFKALNLSDQIKPFLLEIHNASEDIEKLNEQVNVFMEEKAKLKEELLKSNELISANNAEIAEIKEYLKKLSNENIELKAELRRKVACVAKEQDNV